MCVTAGNCAGQKQTKEQIEKKILNSKQAMEVWQINRHTYEVVNVFRSMGEAERQTGIHNGKISGVCNGRRQYTLDYIWRYSN